MINFPNISPEIFTIALPGFEFSLRWYALSYIAGFFIAIKLMKSCLLRSGIWENEKAPMDAEQADTLLTYLILGVILGGRLGYVLFYNIEFYIDNPTSVIRLWDGGMSFHGGFLGVIVAVFCFCRINRIELWSVADLIALATPPGLFLGRIANFINAELWGRPTGMPWGVVFPGKAAQHCPGIEGICARHPSQLYEAGLEGFVLFLLLILLIARGYLKKPGFITGVFFAGYGFSRFLIEFFEFLMHIFLQMKTRLALPFTLQDLG